jgi:hypothetical protein
MKVIGVEVYFETDDSTLALLKDYVSLRIFDEDQLQPR